MTKTHCNRCDKVMSQTEIASDRLGVRVSKWKNKFFEGEKCELYWDLCPSCKKALMKFLTAYDER